MPTFLVKVESESIPGSNYGDESRNQLGISGVDFWHYAVEMSDAITVISHPRSWIPEYYSIHGQLRQNAVAKTTKRGRWCAVLGV